MAHRPEVPIALTVPINDVSIDNLVSANNSVTFTETVPFNDSIANMD
jgi:hypothetical protein